MERSLLKTVCFDLGIPLSYTFLRRYAQVYSAVFYCFIYSKYFFLVHSFQLLLEPVRFLNGEFTNFTLTFAELN